MITFVLNRLFLYCIFFFVFLLNSAIAKDTEIFPFPIDMVYLWVDGKDVGWQKIKEHYSALCQKNIEVKPDASAGNRYSDHEELKYSLRSVWKYASFFNHIYIVTMNQKPEWLKAHPQITIVDHKEIFKNMVDLPTFNSMAIECHLHRIPNLSEHFIYFNDDMFFGDFVEPTDFFSREGKVKAMFEEKKSPAGSPTPKDITYVLACRNTNALLNKQYKNEWRMLLCHAPYALRKSYVEETETAFEEVFISNSTHRFRSADDYTITNGLLQYHWKYQGRLEESNLTNKMIFIANDDVYKKTKNTLQKLLDKRLHTFCLQDKITGDSERTQGLLHKFFEEYYPDPAPWEK